MQKKKILAGCAILAAGYMAVGHILKKLEEKEYKKQYDEILSDWKKQKKEKKIDGVHDAARSRFHQLKGNVLVIGEEEQEKEQIVIQDLLKTDGSAVINDPDGKIYEETASVLREKGYVTYFIDLSKANILYGLPLDTADLDKLSEERMAIYLSGVKSTEENLPEACFLSLFYDQLFSALKKKTGTYPVRFYLGEFGKQPMLPDLCNGLANMGDYHLSVLLFTKDVSQIHAIYIDECNEILNAFDSILFLGGSEPNTLHYLYERFETDSPYHVSEENGILFTKDGTSHIIPKWKMFPKKEG